MHGVNEQHEAKRRCIWPPNSGELILDRWATDLWYRPGRPTDVYQPGRARTLGYTAEQLKGRDLHEWIHHSHARRHSLFEGKQSDLLGMRRRETVRMQDEVFWRKADVDSCGVYRQPAD